MLPFSRSIREPPERGRPLSAQKKHHRDDAAIGYEAQPRRTSIRVIQDSIEKPVTPCKSTNVRSPS